MVKLESENDTTIGECSEVMYAPCRLTADENGTFEFGPIVPGEYLFELDMDEDGFNEVELTHEFDADMDSQVNFPTPIPTVFDLRFSLTQVVDGMQTSVENLDNLTLVKSDNSAAPVVAVFDNISGEYLAELSQGQWILSHDLSDSEQLWEQIDLQSDVSTSYAFRESMNVVGILRTCLKPFNSIRKSRNYTCFLVSAARCLSHNILECMTALYTFFFAATWYCCFVC